MPSAATLPPIQLSFKAARLRGKITNDAGASCEARFRWRRKDIPLDAFDVWTGTTGQNSASAICTDGTYLYVALRMAPAQVIKIDPSDMSVVDSWTGASGEDEAFGIDTDGTYLYIALNVAGPTDAGVIKIQISNMTTVATWAHPSTARPRAVHVFGSYVYVGDNTSTNSKVFKIDPATMATEDTWTAITNLYITRALADDGTYLYAGARQITLDNLNAQVAQIDVSDMSTNATWTGDAEVGEQYVDGLIWDGGYLYAGLDTLPAIVMKIDTSDMTTADRWTSTDGEQYAFSITYKSPYLYVGIESGVPGVMILNPSTMAKVSIWEAPQTAQNCITTLGNYVFFGQFLTPAKVYKVGEWALTGWQNSLGTDDTFHDDVSALTAKTEYEFQAQARNPGEGDWSASRYFSFASPLPVFRPGT